MQKSTSPFPKTLYMTAVTRSPAKPSATLLRNSGDVSSESEKYDKTSSRASFACVNEPSTSAGPSRLFCSTSPVQGVSATLSPCVRQT